MVGGALVRRFQNDANVELVLRTRAELDLTNQAAVETFFGAVVVLGQLVYLPKNGAAAIDGGVPAHRSARGD